MKALRYLIFFPSVTFGVMQAEVFPYAILYALLLHIRTRLSILLYLAIGTLVVSSIFSLFQSGSWLLLGEVTRSLAAYLNPLLVFSVLLNAQSKEIDSLVKISKHLIVFLLVLGTLQHIGFMKIINPVFEFLVPRSSATSLGYRGITLLSTEPARASVEFIFLYLVVRVSWMPRKYRLLFDMAMLVIIFFVFKSATGIIIAFVFLAIFNRKLTFILFCLTILLSPLITETFSLGRGFDLFVEVLSLPQDQAFQLIMNTSGNRLVSIISAFHYGWQFPFGGGVGNWQETSALALGLTGIDSSQLNYFNAEWKDGSLSFRASGYMSNLMLDIGIIGVLMMTVLIFYLSSSYCWSSPFHRRLMLFFLFNIFFIGSVGTPVVWIVTAIIFRYTTGWELDRGVNPMMTLRKSGSTS